MKLKTLLLGIILVFSCSMVHAQKVDFKKGDVLVDDVKAFEFDRKSANTEISIYTPGRETEILFIRRNKNETPSDSEDDFVQITFIKAGITMENAKFKSKSYSWLVEKLMEEKVLALDGTINPEMMDVFISKYDERITDRTIRR